MKCYGLSDAGRVRKNNEDSIYYSTIPVGMLPNLFVVADGMGGYRAGEVASKFAIEEAIDSITRTRALDPPQILIDAVRAANDKVVAAARHDSRFDGMGTTFVAATIIGSVLFVANVGDSRLYIIRRGISQVTRDHSWIEEIMRSLGLDEGSEQYRANKHMITRALGAEATVKSDIFRENLEVGDLVLLCSDGLTNMVSDEEIYEIIQRYHTPEDMVKGLVRTGIEHGGHDNLSAIIVDPDLSEVDIWC